MAPGARGRRRDLGTVRCGAVDHRCGRGGRRCGGGSFLRAAARRAAGAGGGKPAGAAGGGRGMSDREKVRLPKQVTPKPDRTASAPYNFVPLPERVVTAVHSADELPDHHTYADASYPHNGHFDVTL